MSLISLYVMQWRGGGGATTVLYATHDLMSTTWCSSWGLGNKRVGGLEIFTEGRRGFLREKRLQRDGMGQGKGVEAK